SETDANPITMLEAENARLKHENQALREFIKYSPGANAIFDTDMQYIEASNGFMEGYDIVGQPYLGRSHYDLFPEMPQRWRDKHSKVIHEGHIERDEADAFEREDGSIIYNQWEVRPWFMQDGSIGGLIMYTDVVTEQIELQQQAKELFHNLRQSEERYESILSHLPDMVFTFDAKGTFKYVKPSEQLIAPPENLIGKTVADFFSETMVTEIKHQLQQTIKTHEMQVYHYSLEVPQQGVRHYEGRFIPYQDDEVIFVSRDMTEKYADEAERERLQQEIIDRQRDALKELSTPIIPLMERIIVLPIVGSIDRDRARNLMRDLLAGIHEHRARTVILDITGVSVVDSGVADYLNRTIQAARLKGAHTIITGIADNVAETIVDLGIDWTTLETMRDLQSGLLLALRRAGVQISRME
ncbi:MAG: PAS domain-containing protein, partial [Aggregatilineales bacterium]